MTRRLLLACVVALQLAAAQAADPASAAASSASAAVSATAAAVSAAAPASIPATAVASPAVPAAPAPTLANDARPMAPVTVNGPSAGNLLQTIAALLFVLGLLAVFAWVMKRYGPRNSIGGANVKMVGALNLGGRERIIVVEVGEQWIVVGASPGRVNALATMPKQEGVAALLAPQQPASGSFAEWLKQTIDKRNAS
jgi:flagellar protein FliO/FliZ